ncbi:MAG: molybdopterin molybdotransferase MoeA [Promethearchaeota archaeon]
MKFLKTISVQKFKNMLDDIPGIILEKEIIPLEKSFNRVLSRDIKSELNVPHFRKSRMDGYAVIAEDTFGAEEDNLVSLELLESIQAGDIPLRKLERGKCSYVATGAAIPDNADGVVIVEYTERIENKILISKSITPGIYVINIGYDVKKGEIMCKKDTLIDLPTMGILSACGINQVPVYKKVLVSLISTGNEIVSHNVKELKIGKIYDINSIVLKQAIKNTGVNVKFLGVVKDDFKKLKNIIDNALIESDIVILSGGTSKGEGDLGPEVLKTYKDIEIMVHGVRIKPGKPLIFAKFVNKMIFILPGYPVSSLSCFYVFIDDFLRKISGYPLKKKKSKKIEVGERIYSTIGRHEFKQVKIEEVDGVTKIYPIKTGSEAISTMFKSDGYIEIEELEAIVEKGVKRRVFFF